jgi:hypothetical protein
MGVERTLRTEELSGDVQGLTSHNDNLLSVEQLLSHSAGQPTKEVTLAIDRDLLPTHKPLVILLSSPSLHPLKFSQQKCVDVAKLKQRRRGANLRLARRSTCCPTSRGMRRQASKGCRYPLPSILVEEVVVFVVGIVLGFFGARSRSPNCEGRLAWFFSLRSRTRANTLKIFKFKLGEGKRLKFNTFFREDELIVTCLHQCLIEHFMFICAVVRSS